MPSWFKGTVEGGKEGAPKKLGEQSGSKMFPPLAEVETGSYVPELDMGLDADDALTFPEQEAFDALDRWRRVGDDAPRNETAAAKETELVKLYLELSKNPPANFRSSVREDIRRESALTVKWWTAESLHRYLSEGEVWKRPSFTEAVFEEIRVRMARGDMSPRE